MLLKTQTRFNRKIVDTEVPLKSEVKALAGTEVLISSCTKTALPLCPSLDFPFPRPWVRFKLFLCLLHAKHFDKAGQSLCSGSCHLLNAPENIQVELQMLPGLSATENTPKSHVKMQ